MDELFVEILCNKTKTEREMYQHSYWC